MSDFDDKEIKVSVLCLAYNHEKYIEKMLNSVLNQKTSFKFEILINDDCSTDNTAKIIKEYAIKYPNIIRPIYQKENQHSKNIQILSTILYPLAKGKYFAICEGDDYWIDENKLQMQYDFLEKKTDYCFCVHNAIKVDNNGDIIGEINTVKEDSDLTCEDFIIHTGDFISTNSIFGVLRPADQLPSYLKKMSLDYFWQIYLSSLGKTFCFSQKLSAYRVNSIGSWHEMVFQNKEKFIQHKQKVIENLKVFNGETNYIYNKIVEKKIYKDEIYMIMVNENYHELKNKKYEDYIKTLSYKERVNIFLKANFSFLCKLLKKILKRGK